MIRPATRSDFSAVFDIYMHPEVVPYLGFDPMSRDEFGPIFDDLVDSGSFHVWEESGAVKGFCRVSRYAGRARHGAYLGPFAVHPDERGKGLAGKMLDRVISDLKQQGILRMDLMAEEDNPRAIAFYRKYGFEVEGVIRRAYKRSHQDHYVNEIYMSLLFPPLCAT